MLPSEQVLLAEINRVTQAESILDFTKAEISVLVADGFARFEREWVGKTWTHVIGGMNIATGFTFLSNDSYHGTPIGTFFGTPDKAVLDESMRRVVLAQKRWEKLGQLSAYPFVFVGFRLFPKGSVGDSNLFIIGGEYVRIPLRLWKGKRHGFCSSCLDKLCA